MARYTARHAGVACGPPASAYARSAEPPGRADGVPGEKVIDDVPRALAADGRRAASRSRRRTGARRRPGPGAGAAAAAAGGPAVRAAQWPDRDAVRAAQRCRSSPANLVMLAGSDRNPAATGPASPRFTADLLDEGTTTRSSLQIAEELDGLGAALGAGSTIDSSSLSLRTLTPTADDGLRHAGRRRAEPGVCAGGNRARARQPPDAAGAAARQPDGDCAARADTTRCTAVEHPYGLHRARHGRRRSRPSARDDLQAFWRTGYAPGNAALVVAGDVTLAELRPLAEKHFGNWSGVGERGARARGAAGNGGRIAGRRPRGRAADGAAHRQRRRAARVAGLRAADR